MIKLIGVCLIVVSGGFIGLTYSFRLASRVKELALMREMFTTVKLRLEYECPATDELLCFLEKNERYYPYVKDISPSDIAVSLEKSSAYKALSVTREERQIVKDTFSGLGTTDLTTQLEMLDFSIMQLETALHEAQAEKRQKTRLYNSLGFMCAILVALLII